MTIKEALDNIDKLQPLNKKTKYVNLFEAKGKILANDFYANYDSPLFTNSAMDGYALKNNEFNVGLNIINTIFAGDFNDYEIKSGECVKIMTGAKLPNGANSVLMVEKSEIKDNKMFATCKELKAGESIRERGEEYKKGDKIITKNIISDEIIMVLASNGIFSVEVMEDLRVGIFASGLELLEPHSFGFGVYNSNAYGIYSAFKDFSNPTYLGILKDEYKYVLDSLNGAFNNFDLVVSIGAASVGDADYIKSALDELNFKPVFSKVAMKPAGPVSLFKKDDKYILVLPGNPMSSYVGALVYARKLVYKLLGLDYEKQSFTCKISQDLTISNNKENIVIGDIIDDKFVPFNNGRVNSAQISPLCKCPYYIICDVNCCLRAGDIVRVYEKRI